MNLPAGVAIRPIRADDDAAMAAVIRTVMPEFGATGCGFAINDPEVDWMSLAYAEPRHAYFVVERDGALILVDDERLPLREGETPVLKQVRFRTLGCYPLTGAIESHADSLERIIAEMLVATTSERQGRVIDHDPSASMEKKKQEGYF